MSEFRDAIQAVVTDREVGTAELCQNLTNGNYFTAEIEEVSELELNTALGRDAREAAMMHVSDRVTALAIHKGCKVRVQLYGQWTTFEVVRRKDDPGDPQMEFGLMKLAPGKDS